jgi:hypothetical protein
MKEGKRKIAIKNKKKVPVILLTLVRVWCGLIVSVGKS